MSSASVSGIPVNDGPDSLSGLYNRYANALYNYGAGLGFPKDTCMDAIHDVFCKLTRDEGRIRRLVAEGHEKFYLFCSLKNRLIDISRRQGKTSPLENYTAGFAIEVSVEESFSDEEERSRLKAKVEQLMSELSPGQKEAVYLRYMQEMSYEEIARLLNITPESARKNVFRAMNKMRLAAKKNPGLIAILLLFQI